MARPKSVCPSCRLRPEECLGHEDEDTVPGGCDAAEFGAAATFLPDGSCRCIICSRCGHHTGNSHQGHYWAHCRVLAARVRASLAPGERLSAEEFRRRTDREFHFCCPDPVFGCELESGDPETCHTE